MVTVFVAGIIVSDARRVGNALRVVDTSYQNYISKCLLSVLRFHPIIGREGPWGE
jgi:hypothetical protein